MKSFDFVVACQVLVEARDAVTPETFKSAFQKLALCHMLSMSQSHMQSPPPPEHMGQFAACAWSQCAIC